MKPLLTKYKIKVTKTDIKRGKPGVPCACPISLAISRATGMKRVYVSDPSIPLHNYCYFGNKPEQIEDFIEKFDEGDKVRPFSFELELSEVW